MLGKATRLGIQAGRWAGTMIAARGIEGVRVLQGFLALAKKHPADVINQASQAALEVGCFYLRPLRKLCKHYSQTQKELFFDDDHPIIRPLSEYQELITIPEVSFQIKDTKEDKR